MLCKNSQEEKSSTWLCVVITISSSPGGLSIPELSSKGFAYQCASSRKRGVSTCGLGPHLLSSPTEAKVTDSNHYLTLQPQRECASISTTDGKGLTEFPHPTRHPKWSRHFPKTALIGTKTKRGPPFHVRLSPAFPVLLSASEALSAAFLYTDTISHLLRLCPMLFSINTPWTLNSFGISFLYWSDL